MTAIFNIMPVFLGEWPTVPPYDSAYPLDSIFCENTLLRVRLAGSNDPGNGLEAYVIDESAQEEPILRQTFTTFDALIGREGQGMRVFYIGQRCYVFAFDREFDPEDDPGDLYPYLYLVRINENASLTLIDEYIPGDTQSAGELTIRADSGGYSIVYSKFTGAVHYTTSPIEEDAKRPKFMTLPVSPSGFGEESAFPYATEIPYPSTDPDVTDPEAQNYEDVVQTTSFWTGVLGPEGILYRPYKLPTWDLEAPYLTYPLIKNGEGEPFPPSLSGWLTNGTWMWDLAFNPRISDEGTWHIPDTGAGMNVYFGDVGGYLPDAPAPPDAYNAIWGSYSVLIFVGDGAGGYVSTSTDEHSDEPGWAADLAELEFDLSGGLNSFKLTSYWFDLGVEVWFGTGDAPNVFADTVWTDLPVVWSAYGDGFYVELFPVYADFEAAVIETYGTVEAFLEALNNQDNMVQSIAFKRGTDDPYYGQFPTGDYNPVGYHGFTENGYLITSKGGELQIWLPRAPESIDGRLDLSRRRFTGK